MELGKIVRFMHMAVKRQDDNYIICEWGCGDWFRTGHEQLDHQVRKCVKRIMGCTLGCPLKHTEEFWLASHKDLSEEELESIALRELNSLHGDHPSEELEGITNQQYHETEECPKRLVICPMNCLEWVVFELLEKHMSELCTKRPAQPLECRLGCGMLFGGTTEMLIQAEDDRLEHENEECQYRMVKCNWKYDDGKLCVAQMRAVDRDEHRDYHLDLLGVITYLIAGKYIYKIPKKCYRLKLQMWGGGGGSGMII